MDSRSSRLYESMISEAINSNRRSTLTPEKRNSKCRSSHHKRLEALLGWDHLALHGMMLSHVNFVEVQGIDNDSDRTTDWQAEESETALDCVPSMIFLED